MNWGKIMIGAVVAEIILILGFNYQIESSEALHFGHYIWLAMVAVIFFWAWRKRGKANRRYGWLKKRLVKMTSDQISMTLAGSLLISFSLVLLSSLKFFSEPIDGRDIAVIAITAISGLGFAGGGFFFEEAGRFIQNWQEKVQRIQKSLTKTRIRLHKKTPDGVNHAV